MSTSPLFESAGQGDLEFWGVVEGPTVIIQESLSELEKINWLKNKMSTSKDWVVWCNSKKKEGEEDHRFEHNGKKLFSSYDEKKSKVGDEQEKKKKKTAGQSIRQAKIMRIAGFTRISLTRPTMQRRYGKRSKRQERQTSQMLLSQMGSFSEYVGLFSEYIGLLSEYVELFSECVDVSQ